eukprot:366030-Chlamydomonas_euryale.AAC.6
MRSSEEGDRIGAHCCWRQCGRRCCRVCDGLRRSQRLECLSNRVQPCLKARLNIQVNQLATPIAAMQ